MEGSTYSEVEVEQVKYVWGVHNHVQMGAGVELGPCTGTTSTSEKNDTHETTSFAGGNQQLVAFLRRKKTSTPHVFLRLTSSTLPNHEVLEAKQVWPGATRRRPCRFATSAV